MRSIFTLLTFLVLCSTLTLEGKGPGSSEQRHFSAEEPDVKNPIAIPRSVLAILRQDEMVLNALQYQDIPGEKIPPSWFLASAIHLKPGEADLIVVGKEPLAGANVVTFWVFCSTDHGYKLVLTAPAHDLIVKNTRWKGHRDIELSSESAVQFSSVLCRFDGERYTPYKTKSEPIR